MTGSNYEAQIMIQGTDSDYEYVAKEFMTFAEAETYARNYDWQWVDFDVFTVERRIVSPSGLESILND
jgi:hypothetical protein